jgi:nucleotide-binding universal stress UspA family protein
MKLHSVMVPLDGSQFAEAALPLAALVAGRAGAKVRLALVHLPATPPGGDAAGIDVTVQERERGYLASTASRLDPAGVVVPELLLLEGQPGPALADELERHPTDLVVMATHGRGAVSRLWLGSVADFLIRHVHVPVLLTRPREGEPVYGTTRLEEVLIPLDTSTTSEQVIEPALAVAGSAGRLTLLHVVEPVLGVAEPALPFPMPMDPKLIDDLRQMAQERLDRVAGRLRERGVTVVTRVLTGMGAAGMILEEAARGRYDLIAMTTHGEGGLRRLLLGSVADKVIRGTDIPLLTMRPGGVL